MSTERVITAHSEIESGLNKATDRTVEALKSFVGLKPEEDEVYACFELFWEQDYTLGYNKFFVRNSDGKQTLDTDWGPAGEMGDDFLPEVMEYFDGYYQNLSKKTEFTQDEGVDFSEKLEKSLFNWFARCWQAAGGYNSEIPTYFCFEKEYKVRDLKTGEIMSEKEAAQRLGYTDIT
jgi:hypothetical protein